MESVPGWEPVFENLDSVVARFERAWIKRESILASGRQALEKIITRKFERDREPTQMRSPESRRNCDSEHCGHRVNQGRVLIGDSALEAIAGIDF